MKFNSTSGFTLLEVLIAVALMAVAFSAILMVESGSINATIKARNMTVAAMLAKNALSQTEMEMEGLPFSELREDETFAFPEPYADFKWRRQIKEIEFPSLAGAFAGSENQEGSTRQAEVFAKLFSDYLSNALREVTITIFWQKGDGTQQYTVSTYWVDLNSDFRLSQ